MFQAPATLSPGQSSAAQQSPVDALPVSLASIKLAEWLGLIVRLPDTSVILVQGIAVVEIPPHDAPVKGPSIEFAASVTDKLLAATARLVF